MTKKLVCVDILAGYGLAAVGTHQAGFTTAFAFDNDSWNPETRRYEVEAVKTYNANFRHPDGSPVCHRRDIREVTGREILEEVKRITGSDLVHLLCGGPPCTEWTLLNKSCKKTGKNHLINEYLRLVREVNPMAAVMEQVPDVLAPRNPEDEQIVHHFLSQFEELGYEIRIAILNAADYGVPQSRKRVFIMFVRKDLGIAPQFPDPIYPRVPITDFVDIDAFASGHFHEKLKPVVLYPHVCTVTRSSPKVFYKGNRSWTPTLDELLWCQSVDPSKFKLEGSMSKARIGIGNGIPAMLAYHVAKCVKEKILLPFLETQENTDSEY